jgi:hypothetical protein
MEPLNVSDHTLVIAELKGEIIRKHRKLTPIMKRPNWRKCDKDGNFSSESKQNRI